MSYPAKLFMNPSPIRTADFYNIFFCSHRVLHVFTLCRMLLSFSNLKTASGLRCRDYRNRLR